MTGYGKATAELPEKKINVEIKSLNSKAMDLSTRIAPAYREKEIEIRNEISKVLERGKVDFSLWIEKKEGAESATPINQALVEGYYKQIQAISENIGIPVPTDWFQTLLRMPDVMTKTEIQELSEEEWKVVHATVLEAINHLVDFRKQEGAALEKKFRENSFTLDDYLVQIESMKKMGSLKDILSMVPGLSSKLKGVEIDENELQINKHIIQSMTPQERQNPDIIKASRRQRIAKGSGTSVQQVNKLLRQFAQSKEMMKQMKNKKGLRF